ncbi:MAG: cadherin domain-containing protein [Ekhidna sp.]|nr:cadherin domain-containing protein [Ekhidna sp.]MBC6410687.1 cadherin domain-containing protein [Ekhidna sp.]MBC6426797.1 cadherin domain-containing protein [Ekhidna sp.]
MKKINILFVLGLILLFAGCGDDDEPEKKADDDTPANTAPTIAAQTFSVAENAVTGTAVGTIKAADTDKDKLTFSIASGNTGDAFALNASTGALTTAGALDFEMTESYTLKVGVSDGKLKASATITVNVTDAFEPGAREPAKDITTLVAAGTNYIWSDETTLWVLNIRDQKIYAYNLADGARQTEKEVFDLVAAGNSEPTGIWSDGTTLWVADEIRPKIYAYNLADGMRQAGKDITTTAGNDFAIGIWSDGTTLWVADLDDVKIYAYNLADGMRQAGKDITLETAGNNDPRGIWSDGTTLWVSDTGYDLDLDEYVRDPKLYAYILATGVRDANKEFALTADNTRPRGIWSDGTTIWVADGGIYDEETGQFTKNQIYAYRLAE